MSIKDENAKEQGAAKAEKNVENAEKLQEQLALEFKSMGFLDRSNPIRKFMVKLVQFKTFDRFILFLILLNCSILAMQTPIKGPSVECDATHGVDGHLNGECSPGGRVKPGREMNDFAADTEVAFTILFTFEAVSKIIAWGFTMHKGSYLRNPWNCLDFFVVLVSWLSMHPAVENVSAVRTVRVLRPLRTMSRIPGMSIIVEAMLKSIQPLGDVLKLCAVVFFVFGILAVQFWYGIRKVHCGADAMYYTALPESGGAVTGFSCHDLRTQTPIEPIQHCACDQLDSESDCYWRTSHTAATLAAELKTNLSHVLGTNLTTEVPMCPDFHSTLVDHHEHYETYVDMVAAAPALLGDNSSAYCPCGQVCTSAYFFYCDSMGAINFDQIGGAIVAIFQCVTLEGWTDIMYRVQDSSKISLGFVYFVVLIFFAGLFVINLALAVIADSYHKAKTDEMERIAEKEQLDKESKLRLESEAHRGMAPLHGAKAVADKAHKSCMQVCYGTLVHSIKRADKTNNNHIIRKFASLVEHNYFTWTVMFFIGVNTVLLASEYHDDAECDVIWNKQGYLSGPCMPAARKDFLEQANVFLTIFFLLEMILKLIGVGAYVYCEDTFNKFDGAIVIISVGELIIKTVVPAVPGQPEGGGWITVLRAARLFRVFKLARSWGALNDVLKTVSRSFSSLAPLSIILGLFMFIFSLLGMQLFGGRFFFPGRDDCYPWEMWQNRCSIPRANFDSFANAFITIFQMMTGEDWNVVMYDGIASTNMISVLYFMMVVVFGNYVILNLFLAILLGGFGESEAEAEEEEVEDEGEAKQPGFCGRLCAKCKGDNKVGPEGEGADGKPMGLMGPSAAAAAAVVPEVNSDGDEVVMNGVSLFCMDVNNCFRRKCFALVTNSWFESIILFLIIVSSLTLAYQNPYLHTGPNYYTTQSIVLRYMDTVFLIVFTIEFLAKHIAFGAIGHRGAYWRDPWNIMDGCIVLIGYLSLMASAIPALKALRAVRTMRALRPLRALRRFPGMKLAVNCLLQSLPLMFPMFLVSFLFFLVFAILGLQLFAGMFWYCDAGNFQDGNFPGQNATTLYNKFLEDVNASRADRLQFGAGHLRADIYKDLPLMSQKHWGSYFKNERMDTGSSVYTSSPFTFHGFSLDAEKATNEYNTTGVGCYHPDSIDGADCTRKECILVHNFLDTLADGVFGVGGDAVKDFEFGKQAWQYQMTHFDNVYSSLLCLFEMSTTEGWPVVMWNGIDSVGVGKQPKLDSVIWYAVFFVLFLIVGNWFVINLFVGAVIDKFIDLKAQADGAMTLMTPQQKEWVETQHKMLGVQLRSVIPPPENPIRRLVYKVVNRPWFDWLITWLIILNILVLATKHRGMARWFKGEEDSDLAFLMLANHTFRIIFIIEAALKIMALGPFGYLKDPWNRFDFFLVISSIIDGLFKFGGIATFFRVFRVARIVRVARSASDLRRMFQTIIVSIPALGNVGSLLLLVFFVYAVLGVNFFFEACGVEPHFVLAANTGGANPLVLDPCLDSSMLEYSGFISLNIVANNQAWVNLTAGGRAIDKEFDIVFVDESNYLTVDQTNKILCARKTLQCGDYTPEETTPFTVATNDYHECICDNVDFHANFASFDAAFITLIRMATGEYWNGLMHDFIEQGDTWSLFYFFTFLVLATFIMLNLVVAVLILNFDDSQAEALRVVNQDHMDHFRDVWENFDVEGIGWINSPQLPVLMDQLDIPLGFQSGKRLTKLAKNKALKELGAQLPDHNGMINYIETLFALAYRNQEPSALEEMKGGGLPTTDDIQRTKSAAVATARKADDTSYASDKPKMLQETIAVLSFQAVYRSYQERRKADEQGMDPLKRKLRPAVPGLNTDALRGGDGGGLDTDRSDVSDMDSARPVHSSREP